MHDELNDKEAAEAALHEQHKCLLFLIVDDSQSMRKIIKHALRKLGYTNTVEAYDGKDALKAMDTNEVGFVICDWNMPRMKGIEFLRVLRTKDEYKELPFLMVSAESKTENIFEAIQSGVTNYLPKPFSIEMLQRKIETILLFRTSTAALHSLDT